MTIQESETGKFNASDIIRRVREGKADPSWIWVFGKRKIFASKMSEALSYVAVALGSAIVAGSLHETIFSGRSLLATSQDGVNMAPVFWAALITSFIMLVIVVLIAVIASCDKDPWLFVLTNEGFVYAETSESHQKAGAFVDLSFVEARGNVLRYGTVHGGGDFVSLPVSMRTFDFSLVSAAFGKSRLES